MARDLRTESTSVPLARHAVEQWLGQLGVCESDIFRARVVVTEACANAVRHAYREPDQCYRLEARLEGSRLILRVVDQGIGFDPSAVREPAPTEPGSHGIQLMRAMSDRLRLGTRRNHGTEVSAEITLCCSAF